MNQTVVGVFRNPEDSQTAVEQLEHIGFSRDHIDLAAAGTAYSDTQTDDDGLSRFFTSLFGPGEEAHRHTRLARMGAVVTVHADSEDDARRAALILDRFGACDVNDDNSFSEGYLAGIAQPQNATDDLPTTLAEMAESVHIRSRIIERPVDDGLRLRPQPARTSQPAMQADTSQLATGQTDEPEQAAPAGTLAQMSAAPATPMGSTTQQPGLAPDSPNSETRQEPDSWRADPASGSASEDRDRSGY